MLRDFFFNFMYWKKLLLWIKVSSFLLNKYPPIHNVLKKMFLFRKMKTESLSTVSNVYLSGKPTASIGIIGVIYVSKMLNWLFNCISEQKILFPYLNVLLD